jgi:hypothetical protein
MTSRIASEAIWKGQILITLIQYFGADTSQVVTESGIEGFYFDWTRASPYKGQDTEVLPDGSLASPKYRTTRNWLHSFRPG